MAEPSDGSNTVGGLPAAAELLPHNDAERGKGQAYTGVAESLEGFADHVASEDIRATLELLCACVPRRFAPW